MSSTKPNEGVSDRAQLALKLREVRDYVGLSQEEVARILTKANFRPVFAGG